MNLSVGVAIAREIPLDFRRETGGAIAVATKRVSEDGDGCGVRRRRASLRMVDRQLAKGNFKLALSLVKQLQRLPPPAGLRGFAAARQVPRRVLSVEELDFSVTEKSALQSLHDSILDSIKISLQSSPLDEISVTCKDNDLNLEDDIIQHKQVVQHEAGHFLVGYVLGVLPKTYKFSIMEDVKQDKVVDASVKFVGFEFLRELEDELPSKKTLHDVKPSHRDNKRKLSSTLGMVLKWLQFTEDEADALIRWSVLNTLVILHHHSEARLALVEAMTRGRSIGNCIDVIETTLNYQDV
ncbi:uncharacterized protein LOC111916134 isoform X2 [Lactuca sativa]|uniref:uncharacterized protein LOC111916134 isoform X2 n=1 Tax=Lactuca sativa TaxID=4236 RepID=UPI0022AF26C3|nr:uncharacterized protein LOC111916134 isoform X2 [Lactuca sativa]